MVLPRDLASFLANRNSGSGSGNPAQQRSGAPASAGRASITQRVPVAPSPAPEPVRTVQIGGGGRAPTETLQDYKARQPVIITNPSQESAPEPAPESSAPAAAPAPATAAPAPAPAPDNSAEIESLRAEIEALRQEQRDNERNRQMETFNELQTYLVGIGLGNLISFDAGGNPSGFLWDMVKRGVTSAAQLELALYDQPDFQARFPVIGEQRAAAATGAATQVMSPAEVLAYERQVAQTFRTAGLPTTFFDTPDELQTYIRRGLSAEDVEDRISQAFNFVSAAPFEVRDKFDEFYGVGQGDIALATYILDPEKSLIELERSGRTAYAAGMGERYNIQLDREAAARVADQPLTAAGISQGLQEIGARAPLFTESVGEAVDLTAAETGVAAVFEGSGEAQAALERRLIRRRSIERASVGGAVTTSAGVTGLGIGS
jgi:hypothetical protein